MGTKVIIKELEQSADRIPEYQISDLIQKIKSHKRIFVYGTGRSGLMLKALAMRLMQIGLDAYVVGETTTPSVEKGDLLIVASASGETGSVCMTAQSAKNQGADLVVISSAAESTLKRSRHRISQLNLQQNLLCLTQASSLWAVCSNRCCS